MTSVREASDNNSQESVVAIPRSRRVGMASPPSGFSLESLQHESTAPLPSPNSPPIPIRSPLRPPARSISENSTTNTLAHSPPVSHTRPHGFQRPATPPPLDFDDFASIVEDAMPLSFHRHRGFLLPDGLADNPMEDGITSKDLPLRPDSPMSLSIGDEPTSSASSLAQQAPMTKRQHALHELLSSEQVYASDLALIREVHIPLALGHPLDSSSPSPPHSSASSSRTFSTASEYSSSFPGPPMTLDDTRIIFSNISELAVFSDRFCDALELALGSVLEGGEGEDRVGALFIEIIPDLEKPYKHYINRHSSALAHLQSLPQTPALTSYLAHTQSVASFRSHAWDIASLLIKPVQRLLKYSLLLGAIIDETPDTHTDKQNLINARLKMEEVARNVNEGRRRAEVVKEVLTAKKKPVNVGVAASVNLTKMKSLRQGSKPSQLADANGEAAQVERMQGELTRIEKFAQQFARDVVGWGKMMNNVVLALRLWAVSFGKVIGISPEQGSEAFDAFMMVVADQLLPLCTDLQAVISEKLLKEIAYLLKTMNQPLKLLASMNEQEPFHYHLLNMTVSPKNRPPAALLAASTNYLALRGQLAAELPHYLALLHKGMAVFVLKLAEIQAEFWGNVRDRWADLWDMLRVEGEMNAGHEETVNVWQARWADVHQVMSVLNINQATKLYREPTHTRPRTSHSSSSSMQASFDSQYMTPGRKTSSAGVADALASLEPAHAIAPYSVSAPFPLARQKTRARGSSDASVATSKRTVLRKTSTDSVPMGKATPRPPKKKTEEPPDYAASISPSSPTPGMIPRTKSMPLPSERTNSYRSSSSSKTLVGTEADSIQLSQELDEDERGRTSRKPSLRRKFTDSLRPSSSRQRSVSKSIASPTRVSFFDDFDTQPSPPLPPLNSPSAFAHTRRDSWVNKRAKYACQVVHACKPPAAVSYFSFPFFTLIEGQLYEVLQEAGHPSIHPKLPLYVDEGEDCLLLCRDEVGNVGWALASFLAPLGSID